MISDQHAKALARAAELWKITPDYWDIWGKKHVTKPETVQALLQGMGIAAGSAEEVNRAIDDRRRREWLRLLPPCVVADTEQAPPQISRACARSNWPMPQPG